VTTPGPATSPEEPWPVRTVARKIAQWIDRLGAVWVEGQLTQVSARPGTGTAFLTLRDPAAEVSVRVTCPSTHTSPSRATHSAIFIATVRTGHGFSGPVGLATRAA